MAKVTVNIEPKKAIEFILREIYFSEFEPIDGFSQHKDGLNFYDWLRAKELIDHEQNERIQTIIRDEYRQY